MFKVGNRVGKKGFDCKGTVMIVPGHLPSGCEVKWDGGNKANWENYTNLTLLKGIDALTKGDKFSFDGDTHEVVKVDCEMLFYECYDGNEYDSYSYSFKRLKKEGATIIPKSEPEEIIVTAENWKEYFGKLCYFWDDNPKRVVVENLIGSILHKDQTFFVCGYDGPEIPSVFKNCKYIKEEGEA